MTVDKLAKRFKGIGIFPNYTFKSQAAAEAFVEVINNNTNLKGIAYVLADASNKVSIVMNPVPVPVPSDPVQE